MLKTRGMVKGMSSIHISIVSSPGCVALSPSSCMSSLPLCCHHVLYPGPVVGTTSLPPSQVLSSPCCCHHHVSSSHVLVMLSLCHGLLVLCLSYLSHCCPCPSHIIFVPHHRSVIMLCVSKVGWDEWRGVLTRVP